MKALILAAGKGERFYPFSHYHAKAMFPLCNRPIVERVLRRLVEAGVTDVGIVVGHLGGSIRSHFDGGDRFGCTVTYIDQPEPSGTGDAVTCARGFIGQDDVLVVPGDVWFDDDVLPALIANLDRSSGGVATTAEVENISEHVRVSVDADGRLTDAVWKPRGRTGTAASGIYILRNEAVDRVANVPDVPHAQFGIPPPHGRELYSAIPVLHRAGTPLTAVRSPSPVYDIDYPWQPDTVGDVVAERAGRDLTESRIAESARVDPDARISGPISVGDHSVIERDAYIEGSGSAITRASPKGPTSHATVSSEATASSDPTPKSTGSSATTAASRTWANSAAPCAAADGSRIRFNCRASSALVPKSVPVPKLERYDSTMPRSRSRSTGNGKLPEDSVACYSVTTPEQAWER